MPLRSFWVSSSTQTETLGNSVHPSPPQLPAVLRPHRSQAGSGSSPLRPPNQPVRRGNPSYKTQNPTATFSSRARNPHTPGPHGSPSLLLMGHPGQDIRSAAGGGPRAASAQLPPLRPAPQNDEENVFLLCTRRSPAELFAKWILLVGGWGGHQFIQDKGMWPGTPEACGNLLARGLS